MIKHYFCEYCGKDFLSESDCLEHERNCEIKKKNELKQKLEAEKKADMDKIISSFGDTAKLCKDYMEKYNIFDIDKFGKTLKDKLNEVEEKIFIDDDDDDDDDDFNFITNFNPIKLTLDDVKFDQDEFHRICGEMKPAFGVKREEKTKCDSKVEDEVDAIIDKLSKSSSVSNKDNEVTYYFNGKPVTEEEFMSRFTELMSPSK